MQQVLGQGLSDPRAEGAMVTVTDLKISPDLKNATVLVSVYPEQKQKLTLHALKHAESHLRHEVSDLVAMKQVPAIRFDLDTSIKKQSEVLAALAKVSEEREKKPGEHPARDGQDRGQEEQGT